MVTDPENHFNDQSGKTTQVPHFVWSIPRDILSVRAKVLFVYYLRFSRNGARSGEAHPGLKRIRKELGFGDVAKLNEELVRCGLGKIVKHAPSTNKATEFHPDFEAIWTINRNYSIMGVLASPINPSA